MESNGAGKTFELIIYKNSNKICLSINGAEEKVICHDAALRNFEDLKLYPTVLFEGDHKQSWRSFPGTSISLNTLPPKTELSDQIKKLILDKHSLHKIIKEQKEFNL